MFSLVSDSVFSLNIQHITKMEGETVTLYMGTLQNTKILIWNYGPQNPDIPISVVTNGEVTRVNGTRFDNRIHTNVETGSITISNLTTNDSGVFEAQHITPTKIVTFTFNLSVLGE